MNRLTGHVTYARSDYRNLAQQGLRTARESAGWRESERSGDFDFSTVRQREQCAREYGVQLLWTFFHYGLPDGLCLFDEGFVGRFVRYCAELARCLKPLHDWDRAPVYTPINEISFLSWAVCETGLIHPYTGGRAAEGYRLKQQLVRATIAACDAILEVDPRARFLIVDPLLHVAPGNDNDTQEAARQNEFQYQAWDMLCGRLDPHLGGHARYLDLIGVNYYPHNQWEAGTRATLPWPHDPRRRPLSDLLVDLHHRYGRPITISETSHVGDERAAWLLDVTAQVAQAHRKGVVIDGICLYPVIDRPDWESPEDWHDSGLWSINPVHLRRELNQPYAQALRLAQATTGAANPIPLPEKPSTWTH